MSTWAGQPETQVFEVVAEAADGDEGHLAGLVADRAVARVIDRLGRALDEVKGVLIGAPLEDVLQKVVEGTEADAAGRALSAALRRAHPHERRRELDRAGRQRAHRQPAAERVVQVAHDGLRVALLHYVKSGHLISSHCEATRDTSPHLRQRVATKHLVRLIKPFVSPTVQSNARPMPPTAAIPPRTTNTG